MILLGLCGTSVPWALGLHVTAMPNSDFELWCGGVICARDYGFTNQAFVASVI